MPDKDPLGMNAPDVKQQPTNDPLGMNEVAPVEKKKNTPSVSSTGVSPLQEYKPSGPTFPEGYAETFAHVNPDNVKALLGAQVTLSSLSPDQQNDVQKQKDMGAALKKLTPPNQKIPDTKNKFPLSIEDQQRLKAGDKLPEVQKLAADAQYATLKDINEGTGVQQSDALTEKENSAISSIEKAYPFMGPIIKGALDKGTIGLMNAIPVVGPVAANATVGLAKAVSSVMDDLDGAQRFFYDALGSMTGTNLDEFSAPGGKTLFGKWSDFINSSNSMKESYPVLGSEAVGEAVKSGVEMAPMFIAMEAMEGMKVAGMLMPKLPMYIGGTTGLQAYSVARNNGLNPSQAMEDATSKALPAALEGAVFEEMGYNTGQVSKYLLNETGSPLAAAGISTGLNAVGFVGAGQTSATLQGQEYTSEQRDKDFLMGFALGGRELAKSAAGEVSMAINKRAWQNWASVDPEYLSKMSEQQMIKDPSKARQAAIDIREEAQNEMDAKVRKQKIAAANAIDGMLDWQSVNKIVADNVTAVKELINNDPTLEGKDDVKKGLLKRVDKAAAAADPLHREAETLAQEIHDRRGMIEQNNSNSEYSDEVKMAKNTPIEAEIKDFEQQIQDLYDPKKQQDKKAKEVKKPEPNPEPSEAVKPTEEPKVEKKPVQDEAKTEKKEKAATKDLTDKLQTVVDNLLTEEQKAKIEEFKKEGSKLESIAGAKQAMIQDNLERPEFIKELQDKGINIDKDGMVTIEYGDRGGKARMPLSRAEEIMGRVGQSGKNDVKTGIKNLSDKKTSQSVKDMNANLETAKQSGNKKMIELFENEVKKAQRYETETKSAPRDTEAIGNAAEDAELMASTASTQEEIAAAEKAITKSTAEIDKKIKQLRKGKPEVKPKEETAGKGEKEVKPEPTIADLQEQLADKKITKQEYDKKIEELRGKKPLDMKDIDKMIDDETIKKRCTDAGGTIVARTGAALGFTAGGKWSVLAVARRKTHKQGGIPISVSEEGKVSFRKNDADVYAEDGCVIKAKRNMFSIKK